MSTTNRITTRSKNAAQHPGLLVPKQRRRTSAEVAAARQAKADIKNTKELTKAAGIKRVAEFERKQADDEAAEGTPRVVTKPKALVRTRSYADVLAGERVAIFTSDVEMADGETGSVFEAEEFEGETTDNDTEYVVHASPPRKKTRVEQKVEQKPQKPPKAKVRDAIKAVQIKTPEKEQIEISDNDAIVDVDPTPKPRKVHPKPRVPAPIHDDQPVAHNTSSKWELRAIEDDSDIAPPPGKRGGKVGVKGQGTTRDKGKGKAKLEADPGKDIGTDQSSDRKRKPKKSVLSHLILS
jgi:hypothetical protein